MTREIYSASRGRILALVSRNMLSQVLAEYAGRPVVALLSSQARVEESVRLDPVILALLDAACEYFVCFGSTSEALHDRIDEMYLSQSSDAESGIQTTWHDDESVAEVVAYLFDVAGVKDGALLVGVVEAQDTHLKEMLVRRVLS